MRSERSRRSVVAWRCSRATASLALVGLHAAPPVLEATEAAFLERRTPDAAPGIRSKCSAKVPGCANERVPVHVHGMRQR